MRVISGSARGCKLLAVPGMGTRPTTDRVKEAIFNIIQQEVLDARVLDLYAGTGQLGIECLSRGAKSCDFIEQGNAAVSTLQRNLEKTRVGDRARIHRCRAQDFCKKAAKASFDLVFLDPPYSKKNLEDALFLIDRFDILSPNGIIICESARKDSFESPFQGIKEYPYGATLITVLRRQNA